MAKKVFITGATGFIGAHVLHVLVKNGYHVRASTRTQKKGELNTARLDKEYQDKVEWVVVPDLSKEGCLSGLFKDCIAVFHVASPVTFTVKSNVDDLLNPAINSVLEVMREAQQESSVKRVVLTASFACMFRTDCGPEHIVTENDFNTTTFEQAASSNAEIAYAASKALSEKAAFDFVKNNNTHFDLVSLCPAMVYGPVVHHIDKISDFGETCRMFYDRVAGEVEIEGFFPYDTIVDVRDLGEAHLLALESPQASNNRYIINNGNYNWQEVADYAHKHFPNKVKTKVGTPGKFPKINHHTDNSKSRNHLKVSYRPKEETYRDTIAQLLQLQAEGK